MRQTPRVSRQTDGPAAGNTHSLTHSPDVTQPSSHGLTHRTDSGHPLTGRDVAGEPPLLARELGEEVRVGAARHGAAVAVEAVAVRLAVVPGTKPARTATAPASEATPL